MNAERVFIDTNIIIYLYSKDEPHKKKKAESLFLGSKPLISIQVLNETANTIFSVRLALQIREKYRFSYFDSLIAASAYEHGCSVNLEKGYKPIQIYSPREVTVYGAD